MEINNSNQINKEYFFKNFFACVKPTGEKERIYCVDSNNPKNIGTYLEADKYFDLFLVNNSDYDICKIEMVAGGFASADEDLIELNNKTRDFENFWAKSIIKIEELNTSLLDFVLWNKMKICFNDNVYINAKFTIFKAYDLKKEVYVDIPILNQKAYKFEITEDNGD